MRDVFKCQVRLASPYPQPRTKCPASRIVRIDCQSTVHESRCCVELVRYEGESIAAHTQCDWVVVTQMHCFPSEPRGFGALLYMLDHPTACLSLNVAPCRHAVSTSQFGIDFDRFAVKPESLLICVRTMLGQPAQVVIIGSQIFGWFAVGPLDLLTLQLGGDCTHDALSDVVLKIKHIFECTLKTARPEMRSGFRVDKLARDTNAVACLAYATFEDVAHTKFATDLLYIDRPAPVGET